MNWLIRHLFNHVKTLVIDLIYLHSCLIRMYFVLRLIFEVVVEQVDWVCGIHIYMSVLMDL